MYCLRKTTYIQNALFSVMSIYIKLCVKKTVSKLRAAKRMAKEINEVYTIRWVYMYSR